MAFVIGNDCVVNWRELVPMLIPSYDALRKQLKRASERGYGISRYKGKKAGGKNSTLLIDYDTMPPKYQEKILDARKVEHPLVPFYSITREITNYFHDYLYPDGVHLPEDAIEKYKINAGVLEALVALETARINERLKLGEKSLKGVTSSLFADAHSFNEYLFAKYDYKHTLNSNERSFKRQFKAFKDAKNPLYTVIIDPEGKRRKNALKRDDKTNELLEALFGGREHKPFASEVANEYSAFLAGYLEITNKTTGETYNPSEFKALDKRTVTLFLSKWESKIGTHAKRSGDRQKFYNKFIPYSDLDQPEYAGSGLSIDDRNPPFYYNEKKQRIYFYLGKDLASEAIIAWAYSKTKTGLMEQFYKNLLSNCHKWGVPVPDYLECERALNWGYRDNLLKSGNMFQNVHMIPNMARSKRIERDFWDLRYKMERKQKGFVARPHARSEANQTKTAFEKIPVIPYEEQIPMHLKNIIKWNNMPNNQDKSMSRFDYFLKKQHPKLQATNYEAFIKFIGDKTETSCKLGQMKLQGKNWYIGNKSEIFTGDRLIQVLTQIEGKSIDVYSLEDDQGKIYKALVFSKKDGRFICEAQPKPRGARTPIERTTQHKDAEQILAKYKTTVIRFMQDRASSVDSLLIEGEIPETISDTFSIAGVHQFVPSDTPAEEINDDDYDDDFNDDFEYPKQDNQATGLKRAFFQ